MASQKQIEANRRNAQNSTGPRSSDGKKISRRNALRHGLTGQATVMTDEDRIQHDAFCASLLASLAPEGALEIFLASAVSEEAWSLNRARAIGNNVFTIGQVDGTSDRFSSAHEEIQTAVSDAWVFRDHAPSFALLTLYQQRIQRSFDKNLERLQALQAVRAAKREADLEQARILKQLNELKSLPYDPAADGFVFSNHEIDRAIDLHHRLTQAKTEDFTHWQRSPHFKLPKAA